jgi:hypothetical protein
MASAMNHPQNRHDLDTVSSCIYGIRDSKREVADWFFISAMDAPRPASRHIAQVIPDFANAISDTACSNWIIGSNICNLTFDIFKGIA